MRSLLRWSSWVYRIRLPSGRHCNPRHKRHRLSVQRGNVDYSAPSKSEKLQSRLRPGLGVHEVKCRTPPEPNRPQKLPSQRFHRHFATTREERSSRHRLSSGCAHAEVPHPRAAECVVLLALTKLVRQDAQRGCGIPSKLRLAGRGQLLDAGVPTCPSPSCPLPLLKLRQQATAASKFSKDFARRGDPVPLETAAIVQNCHAADRFARIMPPITWLYSRVRRSGRTRSSLSSALEGWARFIAPAICA